MTKFKKILFQHYSLQLIITLVFVTLVSWIFKVYVLSGLILLGLTLFIFIRSFKDANFKSKKLITKLIIYFFIAIFLIDGLMLLGGNPDKNADNIRQVMRN